MVRPRRACACGEVHPAGAGCTSINRLVHSSYAHQKARRAVFERDGYLCFFCGKPTVKGHRTLQPTAAHWPLSIVELQRAGRNASDISTMVTAHSTCHATADAERRNA
jgi:5-methylcytosine-specific restriction endonuclease McrA